MFHTCSVGKGSEIISEGREHFAFQPQHTGRATAVGQGGRCCWVPLVLNCGCEEREEFNRQYELLTNFPQLFDEFVDEFLDEFLTQLFDLAMSILALILLIGHKSSQSNTRVESALWYSVTKQIGRESDVFSGFSASFFPDKLLYSMGFAREPWSAP